MSVTQPAALSEHVSFPHFISQCGIPVEAIDCLWESKMLADWDTSNPVPHAPSLKLAEVLAMRQSSLRALGASVLDSAWLTKFASSTIQPGLEGLAVNVMLPAAALATLASSAPDLVQDRIAAEAAYAAHVATPVSDVAELAAQLVEARCGVTIASILASSDTTLREALVELLVTANGGERGKPGRTVRAALVATGTHDDLVRLTLQTPNGVLDVPVMEVAAALVNDGSVARSEIKARAHQDAVGMARRLGLVELAPLRQRDPMTKEAEDVLDQFEVFSMIDPTPAARRAIRWWTSLEPTDVSRILDAADVETITDWCQGQMQVTPDAEEIVELLNRMNADRFDAFCAEVTRRPDPTEEQPALSLALVEPMTKQWRPAGVHAAVSHLTAELDDPKHWHIAIALLANGWKATMWELAACAKQV